MKTKLIIIFNVFFIMLSCTGYSKGLCGNHFINTKNSNISANTDVRSTYINDIKSSSWKTGFFLNSASTNVKSLKADILEAFNKSLRQGLFQRVAKILDEAHVFINTSTIFTSTGVRADTDRSPYRSIDNWSVLKIARKDNLSNLNTLAISLHKIANVELIFDSQLSPNSYNGQLVIFQTINNRNLLFLSPEAIVKLDNNTFIIEQLIPQIQESIQEVIEPS